MSFKLIPRLQEAAVTLGSVGRTYRAEEATSAKTRSGDVLGMLEKLKEGS